MNGWRTHSLGDICTFENGDRGTNYPSRGARTSAGVPFINAGHLTENGVDLENMEFIPRERFDLLSNGKIQKGDILFCLRGSLGKFASVGELSEGAIASSLVIVRPGQYVLDKYVSAYFQSDICAGMIARFQNGAAQPNLSASSLKNFQIPLPEVAEQRRIVGILDEAFATIAEARANAKKNLESARAVFDAQLRNTFPAGVNGWPIVKLGELCREITDGTHNSPPYVDAGVPMLDSKHVREGFVIDDSAPEKFISAETDATLSARCKPRAGDILVSSRGTIGKIAIVQEGQDFNIMGNMILIRLPETFDRNYAAFYLLSRVGQIESIARGAAQKGLYLNQVRDYEFPVPSPNQQCAVGHLLSSVWIETERLRHIYEQKINALDTLKRSVLNFAFSGEM